MGFQLEQENDAGLSGNYWKILMLQIDTKGMHTSVSVGLYKDKASRDAGKEPMQIENYQIANITNESMDGESPLKTAYNRLKTESMNQILLGTVSISGTDVTGVGTTFTTDLVEGDRIMAGSDMAYRTVTSITSDTEMTINEAYSSNIENTTYAKDANKFKNADSVLESGQ